MKYDKIAFISSSSEVARDACRKLRQRYGRIPLKQADVIVVLGGDGAMLQTLHQCFDLNVPIYGMNQGSIGFLMNTYDEDRLLDRLDAATASELHPLQMHAWDTDGKKHEALAINEVSLLRQSRQAAKIAITVDQVERLDELICDGIMVSTPVGSTAYNSSARGPIVPLDGNVLPLTPISVFRPRRWPGALIHHSAEIEFDILRAPERPVSATADAKEVRDVVNVKIHESRSISCTLLFDHDNQLSERIVTEQFTP